MEALANKTLDEVISSIMESDPGVSEAELEEIIGEI
jgi:hypothetical protein